MNRSTFQIDFSDLKLNVSQIEKAMGYKADVSHEPVHDLICRLLEESSEICNVRAEYTVFGAVKFNDADKSVEIGDLIFQINKIIYTQIKRSESIAVFLCTAGKELGIRSRKAMKDGDMLTGYVYDVIGSEIAEASAVLMQDSLRETMISAGKKITNRYSPGYCGWDVAEQHKLFRLIPDNFCGITLNASALMDPEKSVSGLIGIGDNVKNNPNTCKLCDMKDCIYRRVRGKKTNKKLQPG